MRQALRAGRHANVRLYDFRRPDKFSKEQMRTLQMLHDNFARMLTTIFSTQFRAVVQVSVADVQQQTYGELMAGIHEPAVLAVVSLAPLEGSALIEIDTGLVFPMLDRLFGGPGQGTDVRRALTDIEVAVLEKVVTSMLGALAESWANLVRLTPGLRSIESNPMFTQIVAPNEICASITLQVRLGPHDGRVQLCLPYVVLEPILPKLSTQQWFALERKVQQDAKVGAELERVVVNLWVRLGTATVTLQELLNLERGDVVQLDRRYGEPVELFVEDRPKFLAVPGRRGSRLAVRIQEALDPAEGSEAM